MNPFSPDQILGGLFDWTWRTSLSASVLILLVFALGQLLGRRLSPLWQYSLWFLVVIRLLLPFAPPASCSLWNAMSSQEIAFSEATPPAALSLTETVLPTQPPPQSLGYGTEKPPRQSSGTGSRSGAWRLVCLFVWCAGLAVCLGQAWHRHRRWRRLVENGRQVTDPVVWQLLRRCQEELGCTKPVRLVETNRLGTPAVFGWRHPRLLIPRTFLEDYQEAELRLVLWHELVHIQRRDVAANWLLILLQAWHWFNPLVWFAARQFRAARELYCDALVLRGLAAPDRTVYAQTLVKLAEQLASARLAPSLVPVLHRKQELKRRILMMTQHAKAPRFFSFVAMASLAVLIGLTFTRAAEKDTGSAGSQNLPPPPPAPIKETAVERGIQILEKELARIEDQVRNKQGELDALKSQLKISASEEVSFYRPDSDGETIRYLERAAIDAKSQCQKLTALYEQLSSMGRAELRRALPTAAPDSALSTLMENQALYQQQLVLKQMQFDSGHPEVRALEKVLEKIQQQVEERLDGIMLGLKTRLGAEQTNVGQLQAQLAKARETDIERTIQLRPLFLAKRELESLQLIRERLQLRIQQERVDAAMQKGE